MLKTCILSFDILSNRPRKTWRVAGLVYLIEQHLNRRYATVCSSICKVFLNFQTNFYSFGTEPLISTYWARCESSVEFVLVLRHCYHSFWYPQNTLKYPRVENPLILDSSNNHDREINELEFRKYLTITWVSQPIEEICDVRFCSGVVKFLFFKEICDLPAFSVPFLIVSGGFEFTKDCSVFKRR